MSNYTAIMAHTYSGDPESVVGWYASRKLNGNRGIWNGYTLQTLGRYSGSKIIYPPAWWTKSALPAGIPLDGELWHITDDKDLVRSIVGQGIAKSVADPRWADIRYVAFDYKPYCMYGLPATLPSKFDMYYYENRSWLERQNIIDRTSSPSVSDNKYSNLIIHEQELMRTVNDVKHILSFSKANDWEGIVFANPQGMYTCNRSHDLLKSKPLYDHECYVNGIIHGEGKHIGRVGALTCFLTWNEQITTFKGGRDDMIGLRVSFKVGGGLSDDLRIEWMDPELRPRRIRFSFLEVSKTGIPQSPNFLEIANDIH